jgi:hypothetical protein
MTKAEGVKRHEERTGKPGAVSEKFQIDSGEDNLCVRRRLGFTKNKFVILSVEAPAWQGAKTPEYLDIPSFLNAARRDASVSKM